MKSLLLAVVLALPVAASATVAMEPQLPVQHARAPASDDRQHFTLEVGVRQLPGKLPPVTMDAALPQIVPPPSSSVPTALLGALQRDPNMVICYGWGCEKGVR